MFKKDARSLSGQAAAYNTAGQAAIELAIFGSILIFVLGMIMHAAFSASYAQNQNLKVMRMAMLASYNGSKSASDKQATQASGARNSASLLVIEDRLSPDVGKYGTMDRAPQMAQGAGTFSFQMMNIVDAKIIGKPENLPVTDYYINGQHFPLSTASWSGPTPCQGDGNGNCPSGEGPCESFCNEADTQEYNDTKCSDTQKFCANSGKLLVPKSPFSCGKEASPTNCYRNGAQVRSAGGWPEVSLTVSGQTKSVPIPYTLTLSSRWRTYCTAPLTKQEWEYNRCMRDAREWVVAQGSCPSTSTCSMSFDPVNNTYQGTTCSPNDIIPCNTTYSCPPIYGEPCTTNLRGERICPARSIQGTWLPETACTVTNPCPDNMECRSNGRGQSFCHGTCVTYKLFYAQSVNGTPYFTVAAPACDAHARYPNNPCKDMELSNDLRQVDSITGNYNYYTTATGPVSNNVNGDMEFDYLRNADYEAVHNSLPVCTTGPNGTGAPVTGPNCTGGTCTANPVCPSGQGSPICGRGPNGPRCTCSIGGGPCTPSPDGQDPCLPECYYPICTGHCDDNECKDGVGRCPPALVPNSSCPGPSNVYSDKCLRANMSWQWLATAGRAINDRGINDYGRTYLGLDAYNGQAVQYDIDGRLKPVSIYTINAIRGASDPLGLASDRLRLGYEDFQGGDIDTTWDLNSYGPKPGLQTGLKLFGFVNGTYLQIKEGRLYDPRTGQLVSSEHKRHNVDVIQREIQLSNNTYRFCYPPYPGALPNTPYTRPPIFPPPPTLPTGEINPVEVCVAQTPGGRDNCFCSMAGQSRCLSGQDNIKLTCFDASHNVLYVRSRIQDLSGRAWVTDTGGKLRIR